MQEITLSQTLIDKIKKIDLSTIVCLRNNPSSLICCSQYCTQRSAFVCNDLECQCRVKLHENCCFFQTKSLINNIVQQKMENNKDVKNTFEQIENIYNKLIDQLSILRQNLLNKIQNFGLKSNQIEFLQSMIQHNYEKINGKMMKNVIKETKASGYVSMLNKNDLDQMKKKIIQPQFKNLTQSINKMSQKFQSAIIKNQQDAKVLENFIGKEFINYKLLYRASQNHYSIPQFRSKVTDQQNTLVLIKLQNGKIIGGYNSLNWQEPFGYQRSQKADKESKNFIFSITEKEKYKIKKKQQAVYCKNKLGPCFAKDIKIGANQNDHAFLFPSSYCYQQNPIKLQEIVTITQNNSQDPIQIVQAKKKSQLRQRFCGSPTGRGIKIKQWEVYVLYKCEQLKDGQKSKENKSSGYQASTYGSYQAGSRKKSENYFQSSDQDEKKHIRIVQKIPSITHTPVVQYVDRY